MRSRSPRSLSARSTRDSTFGTATGQRAFLERLLGEADAAAWELVIWLAPDDPTYATQPPFDLLSRMGLRTSAGVAKPAWAAWTAQARRPWQPPLRAPVERDPGALPPTGTGA